MIRFFIFYFFVLIYRVYRMCVRQQITGDNNFLSSPVFTIYKIMTDPLVRSKNTFVDVGCGEGIVSLFVRLILGKTVVCCDYQTHYLNMITAMKMILCIKKVSTQQTVPFFDDDDVVFFCVWTSWSASNRQKIIKQLLTNIPSNGILITVSHGINHPDFIEIKSVKHPFSWGQASVYYYRHA